MCQEWPSCLSRNSRSKRCERLCCFNIIPHGKHKYDLFSQNQYLRLFTTGKQSADKFPAPGHVQQPTRGVVRDDNQGALNSTLSTLPLETVNMRKESRRTTLLGVCGCVGGGGHHFSTFRLAQLLQVNTSQDMYDTYCGSSLYKTDRSKRYMGCENGILALSTGR